ncbi:hypothetical protein [Pseudoduganella umbonata]|uniref:Uncharacterized protein n=1 Tax=Pseudoduganella umbonata TaxID=864828 RepID=A0A4P8HSY0_9BURK|nr:hypothetical protein [Pseudoduganella umbonata]MBB3220771.1 hypothetical protein [Pseudoduganella umbonata]QCP11758.1 hypothetical protein FCL38_16015 [Pseudoduganella umbonata]
MKNHGTLAVLLLLAGGLIYSAMQQPRDRLQSNRRGAEATASMAQARGLSHGTPKLAAETAGGRIDRLPADTLHDMPSHQDTGRFVCKLPAEVGPVPLLDAVDAYLRGLPDSRRDPDLLRGLHRAAQQGNWLAKVQLFLSTLGNPAPDDTTLFSTITLIEWMQEHRIGTLYAAIGDAAGASGQHHGAPGNALSSLDIYAAMHHNYPSQYKVGRELLRSGDARQVATGRRMLDCAARALPVYRQADESRALAVRG